MHWIWKCIIRTCQADILNYILPFATAFLAVLYLAKDWNAHKKSWRRVTVLCLIIATGIGGAINNIYKDKKAEEQHQSDQSQIAGLQQAVVAANKNQQDNTIQFLDHFDKMSQKLNALQTQLEKAGLQKEAAQLKAELAATQKALTPPKATLTFSFETPTDINAPPVRTVTLPVKDGLIHLEFNILNQTDVTALDGEVIILICVDCKFGSEPEGFIKLSGAPGTRNYKFSRILPKAFVKTLSVDIQVPPYAADVEFGVIYRCSNCTILEKPEIGKVFLSR
jgi:hypothetical protein